MKMIHRLETNLDSKNMLCLVLEETMKSRCWLDSIQTKSLLLLEKTNQAPRTKNCLHMHTAQKVFNLRATDEQFQRLNTI